MSKILLPGGGARGWNVKRSDDTKWDRALIKGAKSKRQAPILDKNIHCYSYTNTHETINRNDQKPSIRDIKWNQESEDACKNCTDPNKTSIEKLYKSPSRVTQQQEPKGKSIFFKHPRPKTPKKVCLSVRPRHQKLDKTKRKKSLVGKFILERRRKPKEFIYVFEKPLVLVKPELPVSTLADQKPPLNPLEIRIPYRAKYFDHYKILRAKAEQKRPSKRQSSRIERLNRVVDECREIHKRYARFIQQDREALQAPLCGASCQVLEVLECQIEKAIRTHDHDHSLLEGDPRIAAEIAKIEKDPHENAKISYEDLYDLPMHETVKGSHQEQHGSSTHETTDETNEESEEGSTYPKYEIAKDPPKKLHENPTHDAEKSELCYEEDSEKEYSEKASKRESETIKEKGALELSMELWNPPKPPASTNLIDLYPLSKLHFLMKVRMNRSAAIETNFDEMLSEDVGTEIHGGLNEPGFNDLKHNTLRTIDSFRSYAHQ